MPTSFWEAFPLRITTAPTFLRAPWQMLSRDGIPDKILTIFTTTNHQFFHQHLGITPLGPGSSIHKWMVQLKCLIPFPETKGWCSLRWRLVRRRGQEQCAGHLVITSSCQGKKFYCFFCQIPASLWRRGRDTTTSPTRWARSPRSITQTRLWGHFWQRCDDSWRTRNGGATISYVHPPISPQTNHYNFPKDSSQFADTLGWSHTQPPLWKKGSWQTKLLERTRARRQETFGAE